MVETIFKLVNGFQPFLDKDAWDKFILELPETEDGVLARNEEGDLMVGRKYQLN